MERYGYIRVSAKDQNPERQLLAMQEQQISKEKIYLDKVSGQDFSRPQYVKLLKKLKKGDVIIIKSIDRLGRNYGEMESQCSLLSWKVMLLFFNRQIFDAFSLMADIVKQADKTIVPIDGYMDVTFYTLPSARLTAQDIGVINA